MIALFRLDADPGMGAGHAMRCLALANALGARGYRCLIATAAMPKGVERLICNSGHSVVRINSEVLPSSFGSGWELLRATGSKQAADAAACREQLESSTPDIVVVDHYLLSQEWESCWANSRVLVIDDLANRHHDCAVLLDQNLGRRPPDYSHWTPPGTRILTGPSFALLRPEFSAARDYSIEKRARTKEVGTVLVNFGASDIGGLTLPILTKLRCSLPEAKLVAVCGQSASSLAALESFASAHPDVSLLVETNEMALQMQHADLAIGAPGSTSWERCALGLPSVVIAVAGNQKAIANHLQAAGAAIVAENADEACERARELIEEPDRWDAMVACAAAIADGKGVERVVSELSGRERDGKVVLRPATMQDAVNLWAWRNDPLAREMARETDPVPLAGHLKWLKACILSDDRDLFVGDQQGESGGTVRLDYIENYAEVSINVAPHLRGLGMGRLLLHAAHEHLRATGRSDYVRALVRPENRASQRLFESCGYRGAGADGDCSVFRRDLLPRSAD